MKLNRENFHLIDWINLSLYRIAEVLLGSEVGKIPVECKGKTFLYSLTETRLTKLIVSCAMAACSSFPLSVNTVPVIID